MKRKNAFTLIELMVVVAIIAILATLGVGNYTKAVRKARDAKRMSDVASIQQALVLYRADFGAYPSPADIGKLVTEGYISQLPKDRCMSTDCKCTAGGDCDYYYTGGGVSFCLCVPQRLEAQTGNSSGYSCGNLTSSGDYFCLKNP